MTEPQTMTTEQFLGGEPSSEGTAGDDGENWEGDPGASSEGTAAPEAPAAESEGQEASEQAGQQEEQKPEGTEGQPAPEGVPQPDKPFVDEAEMGAYVASMKEKVTKINAAYNGLKSDYQSQSARLAALQAEHAKLINETFKTDDEWADKMMTRTEAVKTIESIARNVAKQIRAEEQQVQMEAQLNAQWTEAGTEARTFMIKAGMDPAKDLSVLEAEHSLNPNDFASPTHWLKAFVNAVKAEYADRMIANARQEGAASQKVRTQTKIAKTLPRGQGTGGQGGAAPLGKAFLSELKTAPIDAPE